MAAALSMRSLMLLMPWGSLSGIPTTSSITFTAHALLLGTRSLRKASCCPPYGPSFGRSTGLLVVLGARSSVRLIYRRLTQKSVTDDPNPWLCLRSDGGLPHDTYLKHRAPL
ncbi:hypothetical protein PF008_g6653 [Phytophthora fragariae]|uniref:Secreted protein n=1 Tax=Phytophthora fragariae TaxID=53985 RepID=A0A6G0S4T9_9STRA|nr:hypothetical protein PF008_g6653 [Phytophthora fragariae]